MLRESLLQIGHALYLGVGPWAAARLLSSQPLGVFLPGSILVRQVGTKIHAGRHVGQGRDYTLFATSAGILRFERHKERTHAVIYPVTADHGQAMAEA